VKALQDGDMDRIRLLLSDEVGAKGSSGEYIVDIGAAEATRMLEEDENLDICEFQYGDHSMLTAMGLLQHDRQMAQFVSTLVEDDEENWRVYNFEIDPVVGPNPQARCAAERQ
jgi:hypothetical protein